MFGNSATVRYHHYLQFRKEKEYARVLKDDARLLELFSVADVPDVPDVVAFFAQTHWHPFSLW